jgi:hypothetical protein
MRLDTDRFERLVRWYPRWWRAENAAAFVGTAMDAADAAGLRAPSRGERVAAALAGLGTRLDATTARVAGVAALVLSALVAAASQFGFTYAVPSLLTANLAVQVGLVPALWWTVALACARHRLHLNPTRTLFALGIAMIAATGAALAFASWSVGFDEADAGDPRSLFAALFPAFLAIGSAAAACAVVVAVSDRLPRRRGMRVLIVVTCMVGAALSLPLVAVMLMSPITTLLLSGAAVVIVALAWPDHRERGSAAASAGDSDADAGRRRRAARALASAAGITSLLGIGFAVSGSLYTTLDSTEAMIVGMRAAAGCGILVVLALALRAPRRTARQQRAVWGAATLGALTLVLVVTGWGTMLPSGNPRPIGAVVWLLPAAAIVWLVWASTWRNRSLALAICLIVAVSLPVTGQILAAVLGILTAIVALVVAFLRVTAPAQQRAQVEPA